MPRPQLQNVDLARLWPEAPATLLTGEIEAGPDADARRPRLAGQRRHSQRAARPLGRGQAAGRAGARPAPASTAATGRCPQPRARRRRPHRRRGQLEPRAGAVAGQRHRARRAARRAAHPAGRRAGQRPRQGRARRGEALQFDVALQAEGGAGGAGELAGPAARTRARARASGRTRCWTCAACASRPSAPASKAGCSCASTSRPAVAG